MGILNILNSYLSVEIGKKERRTDNDGKEEIYSIYFLCP